MTLCSGGKITGGTIQTGTITFRSLPIEAGVTAVHKPVCRHT